MSLMGTLGKVAMGIMVAKGVGKLMGGGSSSGGGGLGGLLGGLTGSGGASAGGLGGLLGGLTGGGSSGGASSGGLGGLLDSLGGGGGSQAGAASGGFGDMLNNALQGNDTAQVSQGAEQQARLMLKAMISAAKADGRFDEDEQRKITEHLGNDVSAEDAAFVRQEFQAPLDLNGLINSVPKGMEQQVYLMSLLGITLDSQEEATYLNQLAQGLGISPEMSNQIHEKLGAPKLYK